ncbi:biotin/lipoyl-binding protein [uncultured Shimia sp.]|uniref:efflux RND transporter periplasmic adaptor subunit n=1 Tax=uncultured Shimia sp. TaxID=573152 RepID=UPI00260C1BF4|nr:biotin/lipoyl-binding protein [uncultured Shimia sp.]
MNLRPLLIIPPLAIAAAVTFWMNQSKAPAPSAPPEGRLAVRAMAIEPHPVSAVAIGYGRVEAVRDWSAVAEVEGRAVKVPEGLAIGSIVEKGALLVEIDRTDYELSREKALANIASVKAQITELDRQEENTRHSLEVEERILQVAQDEFDRVDSLVKKGTSTMAALDTARKTLLLQTSSVTNLNNTLALYPSKRQSLQSTLSVREAELAEAERAISKVTLHAPFRARITEQNIDQGQFVRTGDKLMVLDDISAVEITAEVQPSSFGPMMGVAFANLGGSEVVMDTTKAVEIFDNIGLTVEVSQALAGLNARWSAKIVRMRGTMDVDTGSLGIVVRVDEPLAGVRPINRPPLNVGSFVEVAFSTPEVENLITVPRHAVHYDEEGDAFVYLSNSDNRLVKQAIRIGTVVGGDLLVEDGLNGGETLVLSDPHPPVLGMALTLVQSEGQ